MLCKNEKNVVILHSNLYILEDETVKDNQKYYES